ncbi:MAG: metal ABC transporter permease [Solirubrobacterales bacterium]|nr:MAG: metal ABC transporter permease [Solirubrobacterales bacterium]
MSPGHPSLSLDPLSDVHQLLTFQFMVSALAAGTIVAVLAATAGWYMVLRRQSFAGHTLSVMAFPGAAGAALAGLPTALGYYLAGGAAALAIGAGKRAGAAHNRETAAIGTIQTAGLAAGFLFLSLSHAVLAGPETLLFGSILGITHDQVLVLLAVAVATLAILALTARPLLLASIDPEVASARGIPVAALDVLFLLILGIVVAATSQITGALLVFALLVAPPASAQLVTLRPFLGLALSAVFALLIVWLGLAIAYFSVYPPGFCTTTIAFCCYVLVRSARALSRSRR